jgi:hypothetical protein
MFGVIVNVSGSAEKVEFTDETAYAVISKAVGGYIEAVRVTPTLTMWVNESGLLENLPINEIGCFAYLTAFGTLRSPIVGDVIFTGTEDEEGNTLGIDAEGLAWMLAMGDAGLMVAQAEQYANGEGA